MAFTGRAAKEALSPVAKVTETEILEVFFFIETELLKKGFQRRLLCPTGRQPES